MKIGFLKIRPAISHMAVKTGRRTPCSDFTSFSSEATVLRNIFGKDSSLRNISDCISESNLLGVGGSAKVYRINENYAFRVPHVGYAEGPIEAIKNPLAPHNFGQAVIKVGNSQILLRQYGIPAGVPYGPIRRAGGENAARAYKEHIRRAANMPQSAYDDLAEQFRLINKHGYRFDPSKANNLLLDVRMKRFNIVDLNYSPAVSADPLSHMAIPLLDNAYAWRIENPSDKLIKMRRTILEKCIKAAKKKKLKLDYDSSSLDYSFQLAKMRNPGKSVPSE